MKANIISRHIGSLTLLAMGVLGVNFALAVYDSTYTNFLVNELNIQALQIGALEAFREIPGFLSALTLGPFLCFSESLLAGSSLLVIGFGIGALSMVNSWEQAVLCSVIWSIGFHSWSPLSSSIAIDLSESKKEGKRLGQINSISAFAGMVAMAFVMIFSSFNMMQYRPFFVVAGFVSAIGGLMVLIIPRKAILTEKPRFMFRRQYKIYYVLSFLEGARRQIFMVFAPFAFVKVYGLNITMIALLMFVSVTLTFLSSSYIGKLADRIGPRTMLMLGYALMIGDLLGYAYIRNITLLLALYLLNSILMTSSTISRTIYLLEISSNEKALATSLATGQTIDHIAAVILPLTGGLVWDFLGYETTFLIGVFIAVCLLFTSQRIKLTDKSISKIQL